MHGEAGKGSVRRPCQITRAEENLRWALALGEIKFVEFERRRKILLKEGQIKRSGRVVRSGNE